MKEQVTKLMPWVSFTDGAAADTSAEDCRVFNCEFARQFRVHSVLLRSKTTESIKKKIRLEKQLQMRESCYFLVYPWYFLFGFDFFFLWIAYSDHAFSLLFSA